MHRLCITLVALALATWPGPAAASEPSTNRSGAVPSHRRDSDPSFTVVLELRRPYRENADAFMAATGLRLYGRVARGNLSTELTRTRLRELLGLTFTVAVIKGAGNSIGADAYVAKIHNQRALKAELKPMLRRVWINTDPKRDVGEGDPEYKPSRKDAGAATNR
jgi:hypothetical protein